MVGNERSGSATSYGITLQELRELMDHKGPEAIERIKTQFTNVEGLCELLHTSPNQGMLFRFVLHPFALPISSDRFRSIVLSQVAARSCQVSADIIRNV